MPEIIVTGAAGFIGRALCKRLSADGRDVLAVSRSDGDVADSGLWDRLPPARVLVHLAARSYVPDSWHVPSQFVSENVAGTQLALGWCRRHGVRMVFSSAYVYGIPADLPIRETDPVQPNNPYALSKHLGEQCCEFASRFWGVDVTILRVFNVFGTGQRKAFLIPTLLSQLAGDTIRVMDLRPRRDYLYLPDVVDAYVRALDAPSGLLKVNIGSGMSYSVAEIVAMLQAAAGTHLPVLSSEQARPQEIPDVRADISLAAQALGWKPCFDLAAGIRDMLKDVDHE